MTPSRITAVGPWPRARNVTAVAQPSAARTKNCQGWSPASPPSVVGSGLSRALVEVSELIVDALFERRFERGRRNGRRVRLARPLHRGEGDGDGAGRADQ